jgi:hypothetical protein
MPNFDDFVAPKVPKDWNYDSPNVLRGTLVILLNDDEQRAAQLIGEFDAAVAQKRAALDGRKVEFKDFVEDARWVRGSAEYLALKFALSLQS